MAGLLAHGEVTRVQEATDFLPVSQSAVVTRDRTRTTSHGVLSKKVGCAVFANTRDAAAPIFDDSRTPITGSRPCIIRCLCVFDTWSTWTLESAVCNPNEHDVALCSTHGH